MGVPRIPKIQLVIKEAAKSLWKGVSGFPSIFVVV
jgi:hypothetical protein